MFRLPHMPDPWRYQGSFVFDFGEWVSVGYTAEEVSMLLASEAYSQGTAYRVHRVDEAGQMELIAAGPRDLAGEETMIFASADGGRAGRDFAEIQRLAVRQPVPCRVRMELIDLPELAPPHAVCLIYPRYAAERVSRWLLEAGFAGGDAVFGGTEAAEARRGRTADPIARCVLNARADFEPRSAEEVMRNVREPLQR